MGSFMRAFLHCRLPQQGNATLSMRSVTEEFAYLAQQGADYAAQGVAHVQRVGVLQVRLSHLVEKREIVWE